MTTPASRTERRAAFLRSITHDEWNQPVGWDYVPRDAAERAELHLRNSGQVAFPIPLTRITTTAT